MGAYSGSTVWDSRFAVSPEGVLEEASNGMGCVGPAQGERELINSFKPSVKKLPFVRMISFSTVHHCWMNVVHIYSTVVPHRHSSFLSKEKGKLFPGLSVGAPQCVLSIEKH